MLDASLLDGVIPWTLLALGIAGALFLLYGRTRSWWLFRVPSAVASGVVAAVILGVVVDRVLRLYQEGLAPVVLVVAGVIVGAVLLAILNPRAWKGRLLAVGAVVLVTLSGLSEINKYYAYQPDIRALIGAAPDGQGDLSQRRKPVGPISTVPVIDNWRPPASMPAKGVMSQALIPGPVSQWPTTQQAWIYRPPAALVADPPDLPVLILMPGDPGDPDQWANGLRFYDIMDQFAAAHGGLAPIVVDVDSRGVGDDPACVDSKRGKVFTYLTVDVPTWINSNLNVTEDTTHWAVAGLSEGGTCALQLVVNAPQVYRIFGDYSGLGDVTLRDKQDAIDELFAGDATAYANINPPDVLRTTKFPDTAGYFTAGSEDGYATPSLLAVKAEASAAGMKVEYQQVPGAHDNIAFGGGLKASLPWLATQMRLTR